MRRVGGSTSLLLALPEPPADDELGVEYPRDCGADGTHQAQFRFELRAGKKRSVRDRVGFVE